MGIRSHTAQPGAIQWTRIQIKKLAQNILNELSAMKIGLTGFTSQQP